MYIKYHYINTAMAKYLTRIDGRLT